MLVPSPPNLQQLSLVVFFHASAHTNTPFAHTWWSSPTATCAEGVFPSSHSRTYSSCAHATCTVWWWLHVVVVCGGALRRKIPSGEDNTAVSGPFSTTHFNPGHESSIDGRDSPNWGSQQGGLSRVHHQAPGRDDWRCLAVFGSAQMMSDSSEFSYSKILAPFQSTISR